MNVGILNPGQMGTAVGMRLHAHGHRIHWASEGRSEATRRRAVEFVDTDTVAHLCEVSDVILSICPPQVAGEVAASVIAHGFGGVFVDANATSTGSVMRSAEVASAGGVDFVDASIIGPPPSDAKSPRLYVCGPLRGTVAAVFVDSGIEVVDLGEEIGRASAMKSCVEAWRKGSVVLLSLIRATGAAYGIDEALLDEWARTTPELIERSVAETKRVHPKAWRFGPEMREAAETIGIAGGPASMLIGAAEVYDKIAAVGDAARFEDVLAAIVTDGERPFDHDEAR